MRLVVAIAPLALLSAACAGNSAHESSIQRLSGAETYEQLCSSCHGPGGHGDGPVASLIKTGVPDLTRLAKRDGGEFPTEDVRYAIDGRWDRRAHGARDMPVWGWRLYDSTSKNDADERARVNAKIEQLVGYLRSIQVE